MNIDGLFLTLVLPAPNGCNLKCPFCAIEERGEAHGSSLVDVHYMHFVEDVATHMPVTRLSLQGYEPLLPEVWDLSRCLLQLADRYDLETGLVTNGTYLAEYAKELSGLADLIAISIDSDRPEVHDRLRGVPGAFQKTLQGLYEAVKHFNDAISVNSVLFPKREHYLDGMPELLSRAGVTSWVISPLIDFRNGRYRIELDDLQRILLEFTLRAKKLGVDTYLGDELRRFDAQNLYQVLSVAALERSEFVVRLSPDGTCSRGREILAPSAQAPVWDTRELPHIFLERILAELGHTVA